MTDPSVPIPGVQTPPPRTSNSTILWICGGLAVLLVVAFGFVAFLAAATSGSNDSAAAADVGTPDCHHKSGSREYTATVTVTNSTDKPRDYTVTVAFLREDKSEITTGTGRINRLQPGKSSRVEAVGRADSEFLISCEVDSVRRS
ncbi:MAG TPA: hypothetical protein VNC22_20435 [Sporichthya sp.]|nr:hypothetical protein [Sporichthya sp.]